LTVTGTSATAAVATETGTAWGLDALAGLPWKTA